MGGKLSSIFMLSVVHFGGSFLQCKVLKVEFSKIDIAGWGRGGEPPPSDMGSSVAVTVLFWSVLVVGGC